METLELLEVEAPATPSPLRAYADALAAALGWQVTQVRSHEIELTAPALHAMTSLFVWQQGDTYRIGEYVYNKPCIQAKHLTKEVIARVQAVAERQVTRLQEQQRIADARRAIMEADQAKLDAALSVVTHMDVERVDSGRAYATIRGDGIRVRIDAVSGYWNT